MKIGAIFVFSEPQGPGTFSPILSPSSGNQMADIISKKIIQNRHQVPQLFLLLCHWIHLSIEHWPQVFLSLSSHCPGVHQRQHCQPAAGHDSPLYSQWCSLMLSLVCSFGWHNIRYTEHPKKGQKDGERLTGEAIWIFTSVAEVIRLVHPGEEQFEGRPHGSLHLPHERNQRGRHQSFLFCD